MASILRNANVIIRHQKEKEILKNEKFNIFSVLNIETRENKTHSAFLSELLNPTGSHLKGNIFLKSFLEIIECNSLDLNTAFVVTEKDIGPRNDILKCGGRIDIFISDHSGNCISIENKIYAGDQYTQIERYCNYNKDLNKVYYLTLQGTEPSDDSKGGLTSDKDFFIISYKETIIRWLQLCFKESTDSPILRETIKQYLLLIKKLTSTMDNNEENDLIDLMLNNYEAASYISINFKKAVQKIGEEIRQYVLKKLAIKYDNKYIVEGGSTTKNVYSQIWIKPKLNASLFFGIESFSGEGNFGGLLFIGIFNNGGGKKSEFASVNNNIPHSPYWINIYKFEDYRGHISNISDPNTVVKLHSDISFRNGFIDFIVEKIDDYIAKQAEPLSTFLNGQ